MRFARIVVIGAGQIACDCIRCATGLAADRLYVLESAQHQLSLVRNLSNKLLLPYAAITQEEDIHERLRRMTEHGATLIISANNRYLFTPDLIDQPNVEIINFHYGYLPHYRGMNIPTWTIYNNEPYTGVTWHYVTPEIDHGQIICQEKIPLGEHTTALNVVRAGMKIGRQLFIEFIPTLLEQPITGREVVYPDEPVYRFHQLPGKGLLDIHSDIEAIYRHLRSFDYGRPELFFPLRVNWEGKTYEVTGYGRPVISPETDAISYRDGHVLIVKNGQEISVNVKQIDSL